MVAAGCADQNPGKVMLPDACGMAAGAVASLSASGSLAAFGLAEGASSIGRVPCDAGRDQRPDGPIPKGAMVLLRAGGRPGTPGPIAQGLDATATLRAAAETPLVIQAFVRRPLVAEREALLYPPDPPCASRWSSQ